MSWLINHQSSLSIPAPVRWALFLLMAAVPFEYAEFGFITGTSVIKLAGSMLVGFYVLYSTLSSRPRIVMPGPVFWSFLTYIVVFCVSAASEPGGDGFTMTFTLLQLLVLFFVSVELMKSPNIANRTLLVYAFSTVMLTCAALANLPGFSRVEEGRIAVFGDNPNMQGQHMALSVLILIGFVVNGRFKRLSRKLLIGVMVLVLLAGMAGTGSRSAVVALALGCLTYAFPHYRSRRIFVPAMVAIFVMGAGLYIVTTNADFMNRWRGAYYEGDSSGRDDIYSTALEMIAEQPVTGWHPSTAVSELGNRLGIVTGRDVHNLILDLLLGLGIIGAIPFLLGVTLCLRAAWRGRIQALGMLPFALLLANLAASMFHTNVTWKPQWLVFAIAAAAVECRAIATSKNPAPRWNGPRITSAAYLGGRERLT